MNDKTVTTIRDHFSTLTDPRVIGRTDHKLIDILTIAVTSQKALVWVLISLEKLLTV